jgi:ubiquinol-cytochrome c reductase core subunit 2
LACAELSCEVFAREYFVDVLASFVASAKFTRHEYMEYVLPVVEAESTTASADPVTKALELAHTLAFRSGLGSSLFASPHPSFTSEDIKTFAASAFSSSNIAVLGTGIEQTTLASLVEKSLGKFGSSTTSSAAPTTISKSSYFGGETRVGSPEGPQTVFIGFGASGAPSADLATFAAHISPQPAVKWSRGISPIAAATPVGTSVQSIYLPYSDATLLGLLIQGPSAASVKEAGKAAVHALKAGVKGVADVKKAVAKAKFAAASSLESREGLFSLGSKVKFFYMPFITTTPLPPLPPFLMYRFFKCSIDL